MKRTAIVLLLTSAASLAFADSSRWEIDPARSRIDFAVRHLMVSKAKGTFHKFNGSVVGDPSEPANARIEVTIDPASIDTANPDRDRDLRSPNFFDVQKYPSITFRSKGISAGPRGSLSVVSELAMHGITREVIMTVESFSGAGPGRVRATARAKVNRKDFGIVWNKTLDGGGVALGDEVTIQITVELIKR